VDVAVSWTQDSIAQTPVVYPAGFTYLGVPIVVGPADQSVQENAAAVFSTAVSGCPTASIAWEYSSDHGVTWQSISTLDGAVVNTDGTQLTFAAAALAYDGYQFRSAATNSEGTVESPGATLIVTAIPVPAPSATPSATTPTPTLSGVESGSGGSLATTGADAAPLLGVLAGAAVLVIVGLSLIGRRRSARL
jgi:hypothetical protein